MRRWVPAVAVAVLAVGCTTNRISNMTPRVLHRSTDGLYRIEARWDSNQQALRQDSLEPYVVLDGVFHPMQRTALTTNRWEALVPVAEKQRFVRFRFKFDYRYNTFGAPRPNSRMSSDYVLEIVE